MNGKKLDWEKVGGLMPAIIQDVSTLQVLMLGYMNEEALKKTLKEKQITFFSRTKNRLWTKGETSGNKLELVEHIIDCDSDTILFYVKPVGPTCHLGTTSCFGEATAPGVGFISKLDGVIESRYRERPADSYTTKLFESGIDRIAQKVGEEGIETVIAAKNNDDGEFKGEVADLIFHLLVLLRQKNVPLGDVVDTLRKRHK